MRLAVLQFTHETVTFLPNDTTREDFTYPGSPACGRGAARDRPEGLYGRIRAGGARVSGRRARRHRIAALAAHRHRLGLDHRGRLRTLRRHAMLAELRAQGPVRRRLHGASRRDGRARRAPPGGRPRPAGPRGRRPRRVIAATFDPHGNEDDAFLRHADMAFAVKYFPHYDSHLQGQRAARMLVRAVRGDYRPAHRTLKVPILSPTVAAMDRRLALVRPRSAGAGVGGARAGRCSSTSSSAFPGVTCRMAA